MRVTIAGDTTAGSETWSGGSARPVTVTLPAGAAAAPVTGGVVVSNGTQPRSTITAVPSPRRSGVSTWLPGFSFWLRPDRICSCVGSYSPVAVTWW